MRSRVVGPLTASVADGVGNGVEEGLEAVNPTDVILAALHLANGNILGSAGALFEVGTPGAAVKALNVQTTFAEPVYFYKGVDAAAALSGGPKLSFNQGSLFQGIPFKMLSTEKLYVRSAIATAPSSGYLVVNFMG